MEFIILKNWDKNFTDEELFLAFLRRTGQEPEQGEPTTTGNTYGVLIRTAYGWESELTIWHNFDHNGKWINFSVDEVV